MNFLFLVTAGIPNLNIYSCNQFLVYFVLQLKLKKVDKILLNYQICIFCQREMREMPRDERAWPMDVADFLSDTRVP